MSTAGQLLVAGRVPGERIATTEETADSATYTTTETVVMSVTAGLVQGRTYRVTVDSCFESTAADNRFIVRIREDNVTGTVRQQRNVFPDFASSIGLGVHFGVEYTATTTGNKTFVCTAVRASGAGTGNMSGESITPVYFYVDYIRG